MLITGIIGPGIIGWWNKDPERAIAAVEGIVDAVGAKCLQPKLETGAGSRDRTFPARFRRRITRVYSLPEKK
jgi:hypothetical protein